MPDTDHSARTRRLDLRLTEAEHRRLEQMRELLAPLGTRSNLARRALELGLNFLERQPSRVRQETTR